MTRLLLALFALLSICHAQSGPARSSVSGRVLDPTRTPVVGAKVSAIPEGSSTGPTVMTDQGGSFTFSLDAGKYSLKVSKEGFADATQVVEVTGTTAQQHDISSANHVSADDGNRSRCRRIYGPGDVQRDANAHARS